MKGRSTQLSVTDGKVERQKKVEFPFHYSKDRKLVHVVVKLENVPGALASVLTLLGPKVNLIGTTSYNIEGDKAIFSGFGEVLSKSDTASSIRKLVAKSPAVSECQVWESKEGLLVDQFHTGVQSGIGESYIMLPAAGLAATFEELVKTFKSGGESILYFQGKNFGTARFGLFRRLLGPDPASRIQEAGHIFEALGYGSSTITLGQGNEVARFVVKDCFECSSGTQSGRSCAFTRGLAEGSFGEALNTNLKCTETRCRLKGDEFCEFVLSMGIAR